MKRKIWILTAILNAIKELVEKEEVVDSAGIAALSIQYGANHNLRTLEVLHCLNGGLMRWLKEE